MLTLTRPELAFLAVLGDPELTKSALKLYASGTLLFTEVFCPHLNLMWNAYIKLLTRCRKERLAPPSIDVVAATLSEEVQASGLAKELKDKCDTVLQRLVNCDKIPNPEQGRTLLTTLARLDGNRKLLMSLNSNADFAVLQQTLDASKRSLSLLDESQADDSNAGFVFSPFRDIEKLVTHTVKVPTGINWLDETSSGGGRAGELWLILGAPGGGKSVCAVQYCCAQAMLGNDVLWATFEQSMEGDIAERMVANITDTSLDVIRDRGFKNLPPEVQERFWASVAGVDDRLTALDMTRWRQDPSDPADNCGVMSVWKQLKKLKAEGRNVKTVILDWFGAMMSRVAANAGLDLSACYRFKAQEEINTLIQMAKEEQVLVIVFHQLDAKSAAMRPTHIANGTNAQDMHNMQNFFDLVFTIGIKDANNVCYFSSVKARKGNRITRTLRLIGDKSRFVMEEGWVPNRDGNFYKPGADGQDQRRPTATDYNREID